MRIKIFLILTIINITFFTYGENINLFDFNVTDTHNILSEWILIPNDNQMYFDTNNISVKTYMDNPSVAWQYQIPELKNHHGTSWYVFPFKVENLDKSKKLGVKIPFIYGSSQFYVNGKLISDSGGFKDNNLKLSSKPVLLELPQDLITNETNYLSIRMKSHSSWGGMNNFVTFGSYNSLLTNWFHFLINRIALSFISLFLSVYFTFHFVFRTKEKYNLVFAGLCLSIGVFIMGYDGLWFYVFDSGWAYWVLTFVSGIGMYLLPILFIHSFYGLRLKAFAKIFSGFYIFLALFVLIEYIITAQIYYFNKYLYFVLNFSYILLVIYLMVITIKISRDRFKYSRLMLISIGLLTLSFVYSMLCFSAVILKEPIVGEGFFVMAIVFSIALAQRFSHTQDQLEIEHARNVELNLSLEDRVFVRTLELKGRGQKIIESLEYASRIQTTMLASKEVLDTYLSDFYTVFMPKDIVGGDSYWFYKYKGGFLFGLMDCTGHGVPGAILSTTANTVLERIASHIVNNDPAKILYELNRILKRVLSQENPFDIADDGLDIGLLHYSFADKMLTYSGSKIKLHVIDETGDLKEFSGDRQGIGYKRSRLDYNYTNHKMLVTAETSYYMTTNGYIDQNGGNSEYGFGWKKYLELITSGYKFNMMKQKDILVNTFENFKGLCDQRDDVTLLGFKIMTKFEADDND